MLAFFQQQDTNYIAVEGNDLAPVPHLHKNLEIVMLWEGRTLAVADEKEVMMEAGDLYLAFPNQLHYYQDQPGHLRHSLLIISPDILPEFYKEFSESCPVSPVLRGADQNPRIVEAFQNMLAAAKSPDPYLAFRFRGNMLVLMCELLSSMPLEPKSSSDKDICISMIQYCYKNYKEDISLQSLAQAMHVSHFYISHLFADQLHMSFRDYINSLRISQAEELMKNRSLTITEIAYAVGYNSIRTFNRCFRQIKGVTPTEFRQNQNIRELINHQKN